MAAAKRVTCYAEGLESNGAQVKILMPFAFVTDQNNNFNRVGKFNGVHYEYLGFINGHPKQKYTFPFSYLIYFLTKTYGYLAYFWYFIFRRSNYDVVYIYEDRAIYMFFILLFNRSKICILEVCEIPYFNLKGYKKKINRFLIEKLLFPLFDGFVVISSNLEEYINAHKSKKALIIKVPILSNISNICDFDEKPNSQHIHSSIPYILHTGSISETKDGILSMITAFGYAVNRLAHPIKFIIAGDFENSSIKNEILQLINDLKLRELIIFTGIVRGDHLAQLQKNCNLTILYKAPNEQNNFGFPTKLGEFMMYGIPVIITKVGEMSFFLTDRVNAYVIPFGNIELLGNTIVNAMENGEERKAIGINGKHLAEKEFNPGFHGHRMLQFFDEISYQKMNPI